MEDKDIKNFNKMLNEQLEVDTGINQKKSIFVEGHV